ncbi:restriction endonuclease subunit S [Pasteurella atlantica]|uniref:restriction endonuclease subunit S n=1 Tax=Pasteurellaceae TaxID=712 RepID=UPI00277B3962|nr:restriction endonuclease subunit S [Pasteurella atlantica]MDP8100056.1 restriction endonuclease subunit S [Pasteurella atlantica]MDP8107966.1 restriction endonuclease subunit S [Pasteurella atlantica]MDP8117668.1 restriction endonuclease subunit S [Pasteurella atlantica]
MSNWTTYKLCEIGNIYTGKTPPSKISNAFSDNGVPFITPKDMDGRREIYSTERFLTLEGIQSVARYIMPKNSIAVSCIGSDMGKTIIIPCKAVTNQQINTIIVNEKFNYKYIYYILSTKQNEFKSIASGSATPILNKKFFGEYEVSIPNKYYQDWVVNILDKLDKKIQLNTETNQTLENIAQAIFKSWFIDFDPVHTKANALANGDDIQTANCKAMMILSGKTDTELTEMAQQSPTEYAQLHQTAQAFPSEFGENGLPLGWEMKPFGNLLDKTIGGDWGKEIPDEKHTEKVAIFRGTDLPKVYEGAINDVPIRYVENKKLQARRLQHGDIVIEVSGGSKNQPTGRSLLITEKLLSQFEIPIVPASFCRLFRPKTDLLGYLLSIHLQNIYKEGKTWEYQNQSTGISNFQTKIFLEKELVTIPPNEILENFHNIIVSILDKRYSKENKLLQKIRDTLLPKLLSGGY